MSKVKEKDFPGSIYGDAKSWSSTFALCVTVWETTSRFSQITVVPASMSISGGVNFSETIVETNVDPLAAGEAAGLATGVASAIPAAGPAEVGVAVASCAAAR